MELITDLNELNESHKNLINTRLKELISELNKTKQLENFSKTDFQDSETGRKAETGRSNGRDGCGGQRSAV